MLFYVLPDSESTGAVWALESSAFRNVACFELLRDSIWEITSPDRRIVMRIDAPRSLAMKSFLRKRFPFEQVMLRLVGDDEVEEFREHYLTA